MLSGFCDGISTLRYFDLTNRTGAFPKLYDKYIDTSRGDNLHLSSGAALKIILNRNFVLNIEYARALSAQDGAGSCTSTQASIFSGRLFLSRPEIFLNFFGII